MIARPVPSELPNPSRVESSRSAARGANETDNRIFAQKWRPRAFDDVVGQAHVVDALTNSLSLRKIHHAYLFVGMRGIGKTTLARLLCRSLNCEAGIAPRPCDRCRSCRRLLQDNSLDVVEVDAASRTRVEDVKEILDSVRHFPVHSRFKIFLIDEVHMLSRHSFHALLKILESPPPHAKFVLVTTDVERIPTTVLSRCLQFRLRALDARDIDRHLRRVLSCEKIGFDPSAVRTVSNFSSGSVRDALNLLEHAVLLGNNRVTAHAVERMLRCGGDACAWNLLRSILKSDARSMLENTAEYASSGHDWGHLLTMLLKLLHRVGLCQLGLDEFDAENRDESARIRLLSRVRSFGSVQSYYRLLLEGQTELSHAPNGRIGTEMVLLRTLSPHRRVAPSAVRRAARSKPKARREPDPNHGASALDAPTAPHGDARRFVSTASAFNESVSMTTILEVRRRLVALKKQKEEELRRRSEKNLDGP